MTRRLLESKLVFAVVAVAFAIALGCSAIQGTGMPVTGHMLIVPQTITVAQALPVSPQVATGRIGADIHGTLVTHGRPVTRAPHASNAPGRDIPSAVVAHGPTMPPDPWAGGCGPDKCEDQAGNCIPCSSGVHATLVAQGPMMSPAPWANRTDGDRCRTLVAHGPTMPPDPWAGGCGPDKCEDQAGNCIPCSSGVKNTLVAHGPTMPPDPWAGGCGPDKCEDQAGNCIPCSSGARNTLLALAH